MVTLRQKTAHWSHYTGGIYTGWGDPYEQPWSWTEGYNLPAWTWAQHAACNGMDPEVFFAPETAFHQARARQACKDCPVVQECLEYATSHDEHGWWGGMSREQRREKKAKEAT